MLIKIVFGLCGLLAGIFVGCWVVLYSPFFSSPYILSPLNLDSLFSPKKEVIGFLPYWELDTAKTDYSDYLTTLSYFGVAIDTDGTILKQTTPQQNEPAWNALISGKVTPFLDEAKKHHVTLSLLMFTGNKDVIQSLMQDPVAHAKNLISEAKPLMKQYGFTDLNIDIEYTPEASDAARIHFTQFIQQVRDSLDPTQTLTVEISPLDAIKHNLIEPSAVGRVADHIVIMAYDYHYPDSSVTGPVAPLSGAGITSEFDVQTVVENVINTLPSQKVILGMPLYGYEWETLANTPRSAVISGTGVIASNARGESVLQSCTSCTVQYNTTDQENFISYKDDTTDSFHQLFYPDKKSLQAKTTYADKMHLGGVALWALGYEGDTILQPLQEYKK